MLRHHLFVYGGFSWCLFSFQDDCLKTNSKTRRSKIMLYRFENINGWEEVLIASETLFTRWFETRTNSLTAVRNDMPWERKWKKGLSLSLVKMEVTLESIRRGLAKVSYSVIIHDWSSFSSFLFHHISLSLSLTSKTFFPLQFLKTSTNHRRKLRGCTHTTAYVFSYSGVHVILLHNIITVTVTRE